MFYNVNVTIIAIHFSCAYHMDGAIKYRTYQLRTAGNFL
jgi:hypothetical protein